MSGQKLKHYRDDPRVKSAKDRLDGISADYEALSQRVHAIKHPQPRDVRAEARRRLEGVKHQPRNVVSDGDLAEMEKELAVLKEALAMAKDHYERTVMEVGDELCKEFLPLYSAHIREYIKAALAMSRALLGEQRLRRELTEATKRWEGVKPEIGGYNPLDFQPTLAGSRMWLWLNRIVDLGYLTRDEVESLKAEIASGE